MNFEKLAKRRWLEMMDDLRISVEEEDVWPLLITPYQ